MTVTDTGLNPVDFVLDGTTLSIDPAQFADALGEGQSIELTVSFNVTDGQGGSTPNTATLTVEGLDGPFTFYVDQDGDGFGVDDALNNRTDYEAPEGFASVPGDEDDTDETVYPGAPEINDGKDNNQDGQIDEDNLAPVAGADAASVAFGGILNIPVATLLANDSDPDLDPLTIVSVQDPVNGTVSLADGIVTFTPDPGFSGEATFTYTVSDGVSANEKFATATVTVTVAPDPATLEPVTVRLQAEDADLAGGYVVAAAATADGGQLIWIPNGQSTGTATFDLSGKGVPPGIYTLRIGYFDENDGESQVNIAISGENPFNTSFIMDDDATSGNGTQASSFRVRTFEGVEVDEGSVLTLTGIRDAGEYARIDYIEFTGIAEGADENLPPFAPFGIANQTVALDQPLDLNLLALFADPEDDALTFSVEGPAWLMVVDGRLVGTPDAGDQTEPGGTTVTILASDGNNPPVSVTFQLTVKAENTAPTATQIANQILRVGDDATVSVAGAFNDADGDTLMFTVAGNLPAGLSFNASTGVFSGAPQAAGSFQVTVIASDGEATAASTFVFNVLPELDARETLRIEAETFDLVSGFFVESLSGGRQGIRLLANASGEAVLEFDGTGAEGAYDMRIAFYDENDGVSIASLSVDFNGDGVFEPLDSFSFNQSGGGDAAQPQNLRILTFPGLNVGPGTVLKLNATADAGEFARFDYIELVPVAGEVNFAPFVSNGIDDITQPVPAPLAIDLDAIGAFADPDEDALTYTLVSGPAWLSIVDGILSGTPPNAGSFVVTIGATDGSVNSGVTVETSFTITVEGEPVINLPPSLSLTPLVLEIAENTAVPVNLKVAEITVIDDGNGTNNLSLVGEDADLFEIIGLELFLKAGTVLDFETNPSLDVSVQVDDPTVGQTPDAEAAFTLTVTDVIEVVPDPYAPDGDLDGDGIINSEDDDVDGDGIPNVDDPFAYDAENGMTLAPGETRFYGFDIDGTIYQNGMTGFLQGTTNGGNFNEDTGAARVEGGFLIVDPVTAGDTGGSNNPEDDAQVGVKNGTFTATALVVNPWFGEAPNPNSFDQLGLVLGLDSANMIKLVFGQAAGVVEFQKQENDVGTKYGGANANANVPLPPGAGLDDFAKAEITFEVVSIDATSATVTGSVAFLAADESVIINVNYGTAPISGALAAALASPNIGVGVGFTHVDGGGAPGFVAKLDSLSITAPGDSPENLAPTAVNLTPVLASIAEGTSVRTKVADIVITDDGLGTNLLALIGEDADLFEIDGLELFLKAGLTLEAAVNPTLDVAVTVDDVTVGNTPDAVSASLGLIVTETAPAGDQIVLRINAFGPQVAATDGGPDWLADTGAGSIYLATTDNRGDAPAAGYAGSAAAIPAGVPESVLDTARSSNAPFSYNIPVADLAGPGAYRVNLYIAELFSGGQSSAFRNFDASLEGTVPAAFNDITPGTAFGANVGVLTADVEVTDGVLNIGFLQDVLQNPIVNAIEIIKLGGPAADTQPPTAVMTLSNPVDADSPLLVSLTLADASGINPATLGAEDLQLAISGFVVPATVNFTGFTGGVASYEILAPAGGWVNATPLSVTLLAGQIADLAATPNLNAAVSQSLVLDIGGGSTGGGNPLAPDGDLDGDGILNSADPDVDGDTVPNVDDPFAYDAGNGVLLTAGQVIELDFNTDGTPYEAGFTGLLQAGTAGSAALKPFNEETGTATVSGGTLNVIASTGDTGTSNDPEDDYQLGIKNRAFIIEARVVNPFDGPAANFQQLGLHIGIDSTDFVKFVFGFAAQNVEFSSRNNDVETKVSGNNIPLPASLGGLAGFEAVDITLVVNATSAAAATVQAFATFLNGTGQPIAGATNVSFGTASVTGSLAAAIFDESIGVGAGFTQTSIGGASTFLAQLDNFKVTAGSGEGTVVPPDPGNAAEAFASQGDLFTSATYGQGVTGAAVLKIMEGNNSVAASNFGADSFQVENIGAKKISAIFIDVSSALYQDSVFDPDGLGGDAAAKPWAVNSAGNTGAYVTGTGYFLPGPAPIPNSGGSGGPSNGGYKGAMIKFNPNNSGGFEFGEVVGFSGDMDPNSIAGMQKNGTNGVDTGATLGWDVGGVSGHELIGSLFTVLFDDGTTASGQLISDKSNAGAIAIASQSIVPEEVSLLVNGTSEGGVGTYGGTPPTVIVSGDPGQLVRITMTRGLDPVTNTSNGIDGLVTQRLERYDFKVNNAFDEQSFDVIIGANGTFDATSLFKYGAASGTGKGSFNGESTAPIGFVASAIGNISGEIVALGPVTAPIYLNNFGGPVVGGGNAAPQGYFQAVGSGGSNARFKVQMEDVNGANAGLNPGGSWSFVSAPDSEGRQAGFQGAGYYLFGSDTSTGIVSVSQDNTLEYTILITEADLGIYNFRIRASRDGVAASDQQNDIWLNFRKAGTNETIEEYLAASTSEPEPTSQGFIKIFGGPNNGTWGNANLYDGAPNNPPTQIVITEPGLYTVQIAGRSQGFHLDFWELYKGSPPATAATNSVFIPTGPTAPTVTDPIDDVTLVASAGGIITVPPGTFTDLDGDTLTLSAAIPEALQGFVSFNPLTGVFTVAPGAPLGAYAITVSATDDDANTVTDVFNLTLSAAPVGPTLNFQVIGAGGFVDPLLQNGDAYTLANLGSAPMFSGNFISGSAASVDIDLLNAAGNVIGGKIENLAPYDFIYTGPALAAGTYTLLATSYSGTNASGSVVATQSFTFTVGAAGPAPAPTISIADITTPLEEGAVASFLVSLSGPATGPVTVTYSTVNGTAVAPGDFTPATNQTVIIPAGQTSATILVPTIDDTLAEGAETFSVQISATLAGAALVATKAAATATIAPSDQPAPVGPTLNFQVIGAGGFVDPLLQNGDAYTLANLGSAPMFSGNFISGSAASVDIDLLNAAGNVIGGKIENLAPYDFIYTGPALAAGTYTLLATSYSGTNASGSVVATQSFTFTVGAAGPAPAPTISIADITTPLEEGAVASFLVSLSGPATGPVTVTYSTVNGTAVAPGDFTPATNQTVIIPAGQTSATILVPTIDDTLAEGAETFSVQISATLAGAALVATKAAATATIAPSDQPAPAPTTTFLAVVQTAQDDIELGWSANSPDLETDKVVQLRFTVADGVAGVTSVESALVSWQAERNQSGSSTLTFQVENSLNAQPFGTGKSFIGGSEVVQITGAWQDNAIITNVADLADQINALIASQGPLNAGDTINVQLTGTGATRFIVQATPVIEITASGSSGEAGPASFSSFSALSDEPDMFSAFSEGEKSSGPVEPVEGVGLDTDITDEPSLAIMLVDPPNGKIAMFVNLQEPPMPAGSVQDTAGLLELSASSGVPAEPPTGTPVGVTGSGLLPAEPLELPVPADYF